MHYISGFLLVLLRVAHPQFLLLVVLGQLEKLEFHVSPSCNTVYNTEEKKISEEKKVENWRYVILHPIHNLTPLLVVLE